MDTRRLRRAISILSLAAVVLASAACVPRARPAPAVLAETPPPWRAPRDAVAHIELTGLPPVPLDATDNQRVFTVAVTIDDAPVEVPAYIGIDRIRAVQAPVHTHDTSGTVWLEGQATDRVTLRDFFTLWGVRVDDRCLGAACGGLRVSVDGAEARDPLAVRLVTVRDRVVVRATT